LKPAANVWNVKSQHQEQKLFSLSPEFLITASAFTAGICWAGTSFLSNRIVLSAIFLLFGFIFIFYKFKKKFHYFTFYFLLGFLFFLIGYHHAQVKLYPPSNPNHIFNQISKQQTVSLYGILAEHPSIVTLPAGPKTRLLMQVKTLHQDSSLEHRVTKHKKSSGLVLLTLKGLAPDGLKPGDHFLVKTKLSHVNTFSTPGAFNYKKYLASKSILLNGWIDSPNNIIEVHSISSPTQVLKITSLLYIPERIRHHIADFLDKTLSQPSRGLYKAILIGDRSDIQTSVLDNFINSGCVHILAISGMHMGLLALITIAVITWLLKRSTWLILHINIRKTAVSIAILPLTAYALIAGFNIPVLRSLLMTLVFILAIISDRPENLINHILFAALFVLAWNPSSLFTASFQLSFSAVISLALIYPLLHHLLFKNSPYFLSDISKFDPVSKSPSVDYRYALPAIFLKWFFAGISLTAAAMIGTLPLLLLHFNRISLVSAVTNLAVEPLICFWSLIIGITASIFIPLAPNIAQALFKAGSLGLIIAEKICAYFSALPYASLYLPTPSLPEIIFFYLFIISFVMTFYLETTRKRYCLFIGFFSFCCLLASPAISKITRHLSLATSVSILDVGHGSSILLQLPHNKNILIDGGGAGSEHFNIGERVIGPFLWKKQLSHLDAVVVSHPHSDHYNGLEFILKHFHPGTLWVNGMTGNDPEYQQLLNLANKLDIAIKIPATDEMIFQNGNTRLKCVNNGFRTGYFSDKKKPSQTPRFNTNDMSLVLRLETAGNSFLFPADISATMANTLVSERKNLQANILVAPHHGSRSSMSQGFIETVAPQYIAISAGRNNPFNFPDKSFFDLQKNGIQVLTTGRDGTLTFTVDGEKIMMSRYQVN
jgi:competence protein ComEC